MAGQSQSENALVCTIKTLIETVNHNQFTIEREKSDVKLQLVDMTKHIAQLGETVQSLDKKTSLCFNQIIQQTQCIRADSTPSNHSPDGSSQNRSLNNTVKHLKVGHTTLPLLNKSTEMPFKSTQVPPEHLVSRCGERGNVNQRQFSAAVLLY